MYPVFHNLLSEKRGGEIFTLFSGWHFFYIILAVVVTVALLLLLRKKGMDAKQKVLKVLIYVAFGLYIADFFMMPLSQNEINIEKLPFHACTSMCVMCFLSYHNSFLNKYRTSFAMLGFISNLVYLIYPAGVMWFAIHPLSYRVVQTLVFHAVMAVYGFLVLVYERDKIEIQKCYRDLMVVVGLTAWALLGNYVYNGTSEGYSHFFNWFFVVQDPFNMFPAQIAPFLMPVLNIALFFGVEMLIHIVLLVVKRVAKRRGLCYSQN